MHNYTVPSKYKHQTRLGNWSEEWELEETRMKDYLKSKENVNLQTVAKERRLQQSLQKASLTYSQSGIVTFGNHLMLQNSKTEGYLACNLYEKQPGVEESYAVTTARDIHPCSRSVFIIERYEKEPDLFQGDQLHYGQKFRIRVNPRLINKPLYLSSVPMAPQQCAKFSRYQQVLMANKDNINTVWIAETSDPKIRFESNGQLVNVNQPILIKHVLTQQWLGSDIINYQNIFGNEFEVYSHSHQSHNKTQNLIAEKCGRTTVDIPMRNQNHQNVWSFVSASDPSWEFDEAVLDSSETPQGLINKIRHILIQKGEYGFTSLLSSFDNMDRNKDGFLDKEDFKWGLRNAGFQFNENENRLLLDAFDKDKNGYIDFNEFISILIGQQIEQRQTLIRQVYEHLLQKLGGVIVYSEFIKAFQAQRHPDVLKTYKTEQQVFNDFVKAFGKYRPDEAISWEKFNQFYSDISCSIDRDDIFEVIISNVWGFQKQ